MNLLRLNQTRRAVVYPDLTFGIHLDICVCIASVLAISAAVVFTSCSVERINYQSQKSSPKSEPTRTVSNLLITNSEGQAEGQKWRSSAKCPISSQ